MNRAQRLDPFWTRPEGLEYFKAGKHIRKSFLSRKCPALQYHFVTFWRATSLIEIM